MTRPRRWTHASAGAALRRPHGFRLRHREHKRERAHGARTPPYRQTPRVRRFQTQLRARAEPRHPPGRQPRHSRADSTSPASPTGRPQPRESRSSQRQAVESCHMIHGVGGQVGPDLSAGRWQDRNLRGSVARPCSTQCPTCATPGSAMPPFASFTPAQYQELAAFLGGLGVTFK